ncbi:hypothetical protein [Metabacillus mangrovi]|uniref:hypothetical protein n=1 Tax=Metabacillus mangrovi TaxID=1491830 RepID=UPI0013DDDD04|nr:hypothetical protein [Metabacillus mangrovi]
MDRGKAFLLAQRLIEMDVKRDLLLEEFLKTAGKDAGELLRLVQNRKVGKA